MLLLACTAAVETPDEVEDSAAVEVAVEVIPDAPDPTDAVFDPTRIREIELTLAPSDWTEVRDNPWAKTWVTGEFSSEGQVLGEVGVRAFGAGSMRAGKPSLKLSFDREVRGQTWQGLDEVKLDNSSQDVGFLNEFVATAAMRRAEVPASRTGWARLTVNGSHAGFFVLLESVDDRFVKRWFGHDDGPLYSMNAHNWGNGLNPMEDPLYWYEPETSFGGDGEGLRAAADALASGVDVERFVDLEGFFTESIARSIMGSLDSFSADGNNFYLFVDEGRVRIIPWDFDVDLGGYYPTTAMAVDPLQPWLTSPWSYNSATHAPYTDPVLLAALDAGFDPDALIHDLLTGPLSWAAMDADAVEGAKLIADAVHEDVFGYGPSFDRRRHDLRLFLHARWSALLGEDAADCVEPQGTPVADLQPTGAVGWGSLTVDASNWGPGFSVAGEHTCTGLFVHAPSTVSISVAAGELTGSVGLQDWFQACGDGAEFAIEQNGQTLWSSEVLHNYDPAEPFSVTVEDGTVLLQSTAGQTYNCDTSVWLGVELLED
jgi:hypothetical protein